MTSFLEDCCAAKLSGEVGREAVDPIELQQWRTSSMLSLTRCTWIGGPCDGIDIRSQPSKRPMHVGRTVARLMTDISTLHGVNRLKDLKALVSSWLYSYLGCWPFQDLANRSESEDLIQEQRDVGKFGRRTWPEGVSI